MSSTSAAPPPSSSRPHEEPPIASLPEDSIFNLDQDDPMDTDEAEIAEPLAPEDLDKMRQRVLQLGSGAPAVNGVGKGKGKQSVELELADMVLRLTDPGSSQRVQETMVAQAGSIKQLQELLHAQKTYLSMQFEAERTTWEAERQGWWRVIAAFGEKLKRAEEGGKINEDVETIIRTLQSDKRALKQQLQETTTRLQAIEASLDDLRPLLLLKPTPPAKAKPTIFSPRPRQPPKPISADARAEHLLLAARRLGPALVTDVLDRLPPAVTHAAASAAAAGGVPATPRTPRRKRGAPATGSARPDGPHEFPEPAQTPQVPQSAPAVPGLEQILSAARELDDGIAHTASPAYKRRRIEHAMADVDMTPTRSTFRQGVSTLDDLPSGRGRTALDVLAEQAVFGSQETVTSSHSQREAEASSSRSSSAHDTPDVSAVVVDSHSRPPTFSTPARQGRSRQAELGPAFVMDLDFSPSTPHQTPRTHVQESDVRRPVTPSPAPKAGFSPRKRKRSPEPVPIPERAPAPAPAPAPPAEPEVELEPEWDTLVAKAFPEPPEVAETEKDKDEDKDKEKPSEQSQPPPDRGIIHESLIETFRIVNPQTLPGPVIPSTAIRETELGEPSTGPGTLAAGSVDLAVTDKDVADAVAFLASATVQADRGQLARIANEMPKRQRSPYVKWSKEEDELLTRAVAKYGQKWDLVQKALPSRGYHQVRQRWLRKLGVFDTNKIDGTPQTPSPGPSHSTVLAQLGMQASAASMGSPTGPRLGLAPLSSEVVPNPAALLFPPGASETGSPILGMTANGSGMELDSPGPTPTPTPSVTAA